MQMVGATKGFIRKPFMITNIKLGIIGAFTAQLSLGILLGYLDYLFPSLGLINDLPLLGTLSIAIFTIGIVIAASSTFFAAQRFLNLRTSELYY
jgi:cell division transport system permease protein